MNVLVLGGTGAMGIHLVQLLADNGIDTVVTSRSKRTSEGCVSYLLGNAHDLEFLEPILDKHWDVIVDFMVYKTYELLNRIDLLLSATTQYVFLSSARVYAGSDFHIDESASRLLDVSTDKEFLATDEYSLAKARQENILMKNGNSNWTIIRPYITYSESRLQLGVLEKEEWLYRALNRRTIVFSNDIKSKSTTMTYGLDVSKGIVAVAGKSSALGEVFHVTSGCSVSWSKVLSIYLEVLEDYLGYRPRVLLLGLNEFSQCKNAEYQIKYDRLFNRKFDNTKINEYIDISNFVEIEKGLSNCLRSFLRDPVFKGINWGAEALKDRQTKEFSSLREIPGMRQKIRYLMSRFF